MSLFDTNELLQRALWLVPWIFSLTFHEFAHAWSAHRLGDDTAERLGRMSFNPLVHIDPIGTILLPLVGVPLAWAKPVPVNPARFRSDVPMAKGMMLTALAGPLTNVILALGSAIGLGILIRFLPASAGTDSGVGFFLRMMIVTNTALAVFNMLPIPPLDGSRVVDFLLPYRFRPAWAGVQRFGILLLIPLLFLGRGIITWPLNQLLSALYGLVRVIA